MRHNPESLAYRVTSAAGRSAVYSGDTDYNENLIALSKNADLLICESAFPDDAKTAGHLTPSLAGEIATQANVKTLVLTHLYPQCDLVDIAGQCRRTYRGKLILARDLQRIVV
jgi:ribonuclease BN (tRNA processing enzyme)